VNKKANLLQDCSGDNLSIINIIGPFVQPRLFDHLFVRTPAKRVNGPITGNDLFVSTSIIVPFDALQIQ